MHKFCLSETRVWRNHKRHSLFRETTMIFLPTILHALCFVAELGAQKGPQKWAPGRQLHRRRPINAARAPIEHERSFSMWRSTNPSKGAKASITRSMVPPSVSRAVQCSRSNRTAKNVEIATMGWRRRIRPMVAAGVDKSAPRAHFWPLLGT